MLIKQAQPLSLREAPGDSPDPALQTLSQNATVDDISHQAPDVNTQDGGDDVDMYFVVP